MDAQEPPITSSVQAGYGSTSTTNTRAPPPHLAIGGSSQTDAKPNGAQAPAHPGEMGFRERKPIWDKLGKFNPQMTLKNTGSVARDHLALERTWLAWTRTSLYIASTGVALVQLFALSAQSATNGSGDPIASQLMAVAKPLGAATIAFAFLVLMFGSARYFQVQYALTQQTFPPARVSPVIMSVFMTALVVAVFAVVVSLTR